MFFIKQRFKLFQQRRITEEQLRESLAFMSEGKHTVVVGLSPSGLHYITYDLEIVCSGKRDIPKGMMS